MAKITVYSRSNVTGNPYLWRPNGNIVKKDKEVPLKELNKEHYCDGVNDFLTTYVSKRVWVVQSGSWEAPLYVQCYYVE